MLLSKEKESTPHTPGPEERKQRNPEMSPLTLRRTYMARARKNTRPHPAHPPAARAAAATQAQPPNLNSRFEIQTEKSTTPNRISRLTRFKPGFEWETECELSQAFRRPPRLFKEDTPFYPWLPLEPRVNFHLNFKF